MKTYCKRLVVSNTKRVQESIEGYLHNKYKKNSTVRFASRYTGRSRDYVRENFRPGNDFWKKTIRGLAEDMAMHIRNRTVREHILADAYGYPVIRYTKIKDKGSGKIRTLGLETVLFRLYEVVADDAAVPLWRAKVGIYQVASIKGRGQNYGKKAVRRWLAADPDGTRHMAKSDIRQCYPSIEHGRLRHFLSRDLHKSDELLYMFLTFIDLYEEYPDPESEDAGKGILIGSPASKDLCNYFLSYAYHYASERLVKMTTRRGVRAKKRLVEHVIFYADDIVLYSGNKKDLHRGFGQLAEYMAENLGLQIKPDWVISKTMYEDKSGRSRGGMLDYMGFRFHGGKVKAKSYPGGKKVRHRKVWVTVRSRIFLTARRKRKAFSCLLRKKLQVSLRFAQSVVSQYGWFINTNMEKYRKRNHVDKLLRIARKIISDYAKGKPYKTDKYYKMWRRRKYV